MPDLKTNYMGLRLRSPLIASASPLSEDLDMVRRLEDAGVGAVVMHSLFEEQIEREQHHLHLQLAHGEESHAEVSSYFPALPDFRMGPERYLEHLHKVKHAVRIPIFGSLNGASPGGWVSYAQRMQEAGADGIELNIYHLSTDIALAAQSLEAGFVELVREVKSKVSIPLAVKLSPYFTATANMAARLSEAGADALVLFNRFYQPDLDVERLTVDPRLELSNSSELRLRLRWTAILHGRIAADIAITGGIHTALDLTKALMAGANAGMMTSALLQRGPSHAAHVLHAFNTWLNEHDYASAEQMIGSMSQQNVAESTAFERANYLKVLGAYTMPA